MKPFDFFCLKRPCSGSIYYAAFCLYALTALAEPTQEFTPNPSNTLILSLSDKWLDAESTRQTGFQTSAQTGAVNLLADKAPTKKANIGCNMDINNIPVPDNSLTSRLIGQCSLKY